MGARGPVPTPRAVLAARGSRLAAGADTEPRFPKGQPKCPAWLPKAAKAEWRRVAPMLEDQGLLTVADQQTLAAYCLAVHEAQAATEMLEAEGRTIRVGTQTQPHPAVSMQRSALALVKQFSAMFGFSPSCRTRVRAAPRREEPTGKARFFDPGA